MSDRRPPPCSAIRLAAATALLAVAVPSASRAAVVATYTFPGFDPIGDLLFPLTANLSFTPVVRVGVKPVYIRDRFASTGYSEGGVLDPDNSYVEFTLTADATTSFVLDSISLTHSRTEVDTGLSGPQMAEVRASFESFDPGSGTGSSFVPETFVSTSTWDFDDYTSSFGDSVTFRIYGWAAAGGPDPDMLFILDDITINGTVIATVTPEPVAVLSLVPLATALTGRRRRRRRTP